MKNYNFIQPYSDEKLEWNSETQHYQLTIEYCKNVFDSTFKDDGVLQSRIKKNTRVVYNQINLRVATVNRPVISFLLARTQEGRDFLLEILSAQMDADIQTGYNDLGYQPAINFNGQDKDRDQIKRNILCVAAEQIFQDSASYLGFNIYYNAQLPWEYFNLLRANV